MTHGAQIIVDVARAAGLRHIAGATGSTSAEAVARLFGLDETALIDMGDFVGGMLKYVRKAPVDRVSIAGGFAKMTKLGQGLLVLHSRAGAVDLTWLASLAAEAGADRDVQSRIGASASAAEALLIGQEAGIDLPGRVAAAARATVLKLLAGTGVALDTVIFDRDGALLARTEPQRA